MGFRPYAPHAAQQACLRIGAEAPLNQRGVMPQIQSAEPMHHRRRRDIDDIAPRPAPDDPRSKRVKALGVFAVMVGTLQSPAPSPTGGSPTTPRAGHSRSIRRLVPTIKGDRCTPSWPKHDGTADQAFVEHKDKSARPGRRERARLQSHDRNLSTPPAVSPGSLHKPGIGLKSRQLLLDAMVTAISGPRSARPGSRFGWVAVHRKPTGLLPEAPRFWRVLYQCPCPDDLPHEIHGAPQPGYHGTWRTRDLRSARAAAASMSSDSAGYRLRLGRRRSPRKRGRLLGNVDFDSGWQVMRSGSECQSRQCGDCLVLD